ncbi:MULTISPECIES: hypothetical protein [unclassified Gordonia (in: high G+C Gram-positive bacteria)]|uniref:hypothetical protein n=1 Tax=Gordonia sp. B7-2 TaxID=3420932 RepID=UPI003D90ADA0
MSDTTTADEATLSSHITEWTPGPVVEHDVLDPAQAQRLAATLGTEDAFGSGSELPMPWHWIYFSQWPPTDALGADGHPRDGHFLPPIPHRRRMFAGSRMSVTTPLRLDVPTEKHSSLASVKEKHGRSGAMLFVTVRSEYRQDGATALIEEQDLVYRSDNSTARPVERLVEDLTPSGTVWSAEPTPTAPLLFRYSALTSNAHRIHYDLPYTTDVEGYPDLVVHGPLLANYMADLARLHADGKTMSSFDFRLKRPLFLGDRFRVEGNPSDGNTVAVRVVSGAETVHAEGTVTLS